MDRLRKLLRPFRVSKTRGKLCNKICEVTHQTTNQETAPHEEDVQILMEQPPPSPPPSPPIFKLNVDCMDEIFEYLPLNDLYSLGQTCKHMRKKAGEYFKRNFKSADKFGSDHGIFTVYSDHEGVIDQRTQTLGFIQYINRIAHDNKTIAPLLYIELLTDRFESIKHIYLANLMLNSVKVECLRRLLAKVETVQIRRCSMDNDLHRVLLKFCKNLKQLHVQENIQEVFNRYANSWLLRQYPLLEHFELIPTSYEMHELNVFLEKNPTIHSFSTELECLWENRVDFLNSTAKLEKLEVKIFQRNIDASFMQKHCDLLNDLFKCGFYKWLRMCINKVDQRGSDLLCTLNRLEMLCIRNFSRCFSLPLLAGLRELVIFDGANCTDMDILARSLVNLRRLYLANATIDDLLPFIRHSQQLNKIMALLRLDETKGVLDLAKLNTEREKLNGATKVTVYVTDDIFLATKWTIRNGDLNLSLVEIKRAGSIEWNYHFMEQ